MENDLETAGGVAADLAARDLAIIRDADFVGHVFVGELLFGFADKRNFGDGVNSVRISRRIRLHGQP